MSRRRRPLLKAGLVGYPTRPGETRRFSQFKTGQVIGDPRNTLFGAIRDAVDPVKQPGPVQTMKNMSPEKQAEMQRLYGAKK